MEISEVCFTEDMPVQITVYREREFESWTATFTIEIKQGEEINTSPITIEMLQRNNFGYNGDKFFRNVVEFECELYYDTRDGEFIIFKNRNKKEQTLLSFKGILQVYKIQKILKMYGFNFGFTT